MQTSKQAIHILLSAVSVLYSGDKVHIACYFSISILSFFPKINMFIVGVLCKQILV